LLDSLRHRFRAIKELGDKSLAQATGEELLWRSHEGTNSIAIIVQHLHGNMLSRWTDFLTSDGDKPTRDRDAEFEHIPRSKGEVLFMWEEGWQCVLEAVDTLTEADLTKTIVIRGQELDVVDACLRQIAHYGYHIGQIVHIAKERTRDRWVTLSIAKGESKAYVPGKRD